MQNEKCKVQNAKLEDTLTLCPKTGNIGLWQPVMLAQFPAVNVSQLASIRHFAFCTLHFSFCILFVLFPGGIITGSRRAASCSRNCLILRCLWQWPPTFSALRAKEFPHEAISGSRRRGNCAIWADWEDCAG
jgi:hypothetical protein